MVSEAEGDLASLATVDQAQVWDEPGGGGETSLGKPQNGSPLPQSQEEAAQTSALWADQARDVVAPQDSCQDRLLGCEAARVYGGRPGLSLWGGDSGRVHLFAQPDRYLFRLGGETEAVMGKGERGIVKALERISQRLPFDVLAIDSDNGSEFINHHLWRYCQGKAIQFTRSRPYKKDDNAHIEQKNWTHVRKFMGWDRYDSPKALEAINELYENELPLFMNLFQPSVKLLRTVRTGSRKKRIYDQPQTPLDRLLVCGDLPNKRSEELKALRQRLDPFSLS
jgi:hypothetical protein